MSKYFLWPLFLIPIEHRELVKRRRLYKAMRRSMRRVNFGFCYALYRVSSDPLLQIEWLPELMEYKPLENARYHLGFYWFDLDDEGKKRRLEILDEIISKL